MIIVLIMSQVSCSILEKRVEKTVEIVNNKFCISPPHSQKGYVIRLPIKILNTSNTIENNSQSYYYISYKYDTIVIDVLICKNHDSVYNYLSSKFTCHNSIMTDNNGMYFHDNSSESIDTNNTVMYYMLHSISEYRLVLVLTFNTKIDKSELSGISEIFQGNVRAFENEREKEEFLENDWIYK